MTENNYPDRMAPVPIVSFRVDYVRNYGRVIHSHLGIETAYVVSGEATHIIYDSCGKELSKGKLSKGTYYIIPYGAQHSFVNGSDDFTVINFMINPHVLDSQLEVESSVEDIEKALYVGYPYMYHLPVNVLCKDKNRAIGVLFEQLLDIKVKKPKAVHGRYRAKALEILLTIIDQTATDEHKTRLNIAETVRDYVDLHYNEKINLNDISTDFHYAPTYVSRKFKESFGLPFEQYLQNVRLTNACDILLVTDMTVEEIAECMAYSSPSTFRRAFKKQFGLTPNDYREKFRKSQKK